MADPLVADLRARSLDVRAVSGNAAALTLTLTQGGSPLDLTGSTVLAEVYDQAGQLVATWGATISDPLTGVVSLSLTASDTQAIEAAGACSWSVAIWLTAAEDTTRRTYIRGAIDAVAPRQPFRAA